MNTKSYLKNLSFLFLLNILIKPLWILGVDRKIQLLLGNEVYGKYFYFLNIITIFSIVLDLGIHAYISQNISSNKLNINTSFYEFLYFKLTLGTVYFVLCMFYFYFTNIETQYLYLFILIVLTQFTFSLILLLRSFIQGLQLFKLDSIFSTLDRIVLIVLIIFIFLFFNIDLKLFVEIGLIGNIITFFIILYFTLKNITEPVYKSNFFKIILILKKFSPYILITLLSIIYTRIDVNILNRIDNGDLHSGIYALSLRLVNSIFNIIYLLGIFLLPSITKDFSVGKLSFIRKKLILSSVLCILISITFVLTAFIFGEYIYKVLYKSTSLYELNTFKYHSISSIGLAIMTVYGIFLLSIEKFNIIIYIVAFGTIINIVLNLLFVEEYKAICCAITSSITYLFIGISKFIASLYYLLKIRNEANKNKN